ncbi:unnamed protein product [Cyprideis torosa]|uniref:Alanine--tRNA ligase n=1 Tax=Cyprideis torosa TaxID=163714 RepID=A0A7R8WAF9_9CRUS|nr:unnamed protein product [Cyprideis torosa]CAG0889606.1 unnamed protein product [Cyprideis torosa]
MQRKRQVSCNAKGIGKEEVFICTPRATRNMSFQGLTAENGKVEVLMRFKGSSLLGMALSSPLCSFPRVYTLPMLTVKADKGTGVVTSVPSDSPDDFAALRDLKNKAPLRERYGIKDEMVLPFDPVPIINIPGLGDLAACKVVEDMKIVSQNDKEKLQEAKELVYLKGFYDGTMIVGDYKGKGVQEVKKTIQKELVREGQAVIYYEPEKPIVSRSGDDCVVALCDQWFLDYGELNWKNEARKALEHMETYSEEVRKNFLATLDWLQEHACSRTYGLGSKLPWDEQWLIESLSDSTIYMAYYTIAHLIQGGTFTGTGTTNALRIKAESMTPEVWDYIFFKNVSFPKMTDIPKEKLDKLKNEFEFWYPVDLRTSGKDLIPNHLTYFLYNHTAMWPTEPDKWPQSVRANGHLLLNSEKMSKSTGNFLSLEGALQRFGADGMRFCLADAGDSIEDANFLESSADAAILRLYNFVEWAKEMLSDEIDLRDSESAATWPDKVFEAEMDFKIVETTDNFKKMLYKEALKSGFFELQSIRDNYRELSQYSGGMRKDLIFRFLEVQCLMLSPICPHVTEHVWRQILKKPGSIVTSSWPIPNKALDPVLLQASSYLQDAAHDFRLRLRAYASSQAAGGAGKKGKGGQGNTNAAAQKGPALLKGTICYAKFYPEWQETILKTLKSMISADQQLPDNKTISVALSKFDTLKKHQKKVMPFVQLLKEKYAELGEKVLNLGTEFSEQEVLEENRDYLLATLDLEALEIVSAEKCSMPRLAESACPNTPLIGFSALATGSIVMKNPQPRNGLFEIALPVLNGDTVAHLKKRLLKFSRNVKDVSQISFFVHNDPVLGPRTIPTPWEKRQREVWKLKDDMELNIDGDNILISNAPYQELIYTVEQPPVKSSCKMDSQQTTADVRQRFIDYFVQKRNHTYWHSSSVVPLDDPTLLFANAGMNQFKPIFLETVDPGSDLGKLVRAVNSQKCIRAGGKHNDLEDVGKDVYHHTFFEMLGNWSFGDYFKKEVCMWAWEFLVDEMKLPKDRLYVTYFGGNDSLAPDDECRDIWLSLGLPPERVLPFGMKDNFWEMGETGPCGPCSEIHFDRIGGRDASGLVNEDDPNVLEIWNLVFIQFNRTNDGTLEQLPKKHIDCGMGLERLASVIQGKTSNYDTDAFVPLFEAIQKAAGCRTYSGKLGAEDVDGVDMAYRVVADHIRTLTVALADNGRPDNIGRGYVLRRILRRAVRYGTEKLGAKPGFLSMLVPAVVALLGDAFPEVRKDPSSIQEVLDEEEAQFLRTLSRGRILLERTIAKMDLPGGEGDGLKEQGRMLPGDVAWRLHDTYGFPVDLTQLMAEEKGLHVDLGAYEECKKNAQLASRATGAGIDSGVTLDVNALAELQKTTPTTDDSPKYKYNVVEGKGPYEEYVFEGCEGKILAIRTQKEFVQKFEGPGVCGLILDRTCFYGEAGGQIYDIGFMSSNSDEAVEFAVEDTQIRGGYVLHVGKLEGKVAVGDVLQMAIDGPRRRRVMSNHTATHILNYALREVLAEEADQRGSLVAPDRLRFDFTNKGAMTADQVKRAEEIVQEVVAKNEEVFAKDTALAAAKSIKGLRAVFDETYPDPVRVVSVGVSVEKLLEIPEDGLALKTSVEFCGGTHLKRSGDIGSFVVVSEEAIAKGIRRIVALTGPKAKLAQERGRELTEKIKGFAETVKAGVSDVAVSLQEIVTLNDAISAAVIAHWKKDALRTTLKGCKKVLDDADKKRKADLANKVVQEMKGVLEKDKEGSRNYLLHVFHDVGSNAKILDAAMKHAKSTVANRPTMLLATDEKEDKVLCLAFSPKDAQKAGLLANEWVEAVKGQLKEAKGGGKGESAQTNGTGAKDIQNVISKATEFARQKLGDLKL